MTRKVEQRRICWPSFDCTCLEGGCSYCNTYRFRDVAGILRAVKRGSGRPVNRGNGKPGDLMWSFRFGERHGWNNAEAREVER